ncbi:hypothetical protein O181_017892 [Austropuccinia psidii MF-1]|uniref:Uncharacterized protein n=1 Tax=Austropuccinia psidii MF-1 TaxID=1389203 RepID=A0A9Q3C6R7_9BASI|nr:hypothetical protein [Austropuccinia psidii MF-1]
MPFSVSMAVTPCINCQKKGVCCVESATARSTRFQFFNLGKINFPMANHIFPDNQQRLWRSIMKGGRFILEAPVDELPTSHATSGSSTCDSWANIGGSIQPQGNPIEAAPEAPIGITMKDGRLGKLKRNLVVQDNVYTNSELSDEMDGEELEVTTPIQRRRIQSTSLSPFQVNTTTHELIRSP